MSGSLQSGGNPATVSSRDGAFVAQIVALGSSSRPVILDLQTRSYGTFGTEECAHAVARLSLSDALALSGLLSEAISAITDVTDHRQTSLWGRSRRARG